MLQSNGPPSLHTFIKESSSVTAHGQSAAKRFPGGTSRRPWACESATRSREPSSFTELSSRPPSPRVEAGRFQRKEDSSSDISAPPRMRLVHLFRQSSPWGPEAWDALRQLRDHDPFRSPARLAADPRGIPYSGIPSHPAPGGTAQARMASGPTMGLSYPASPNAVEVSRARFWRKIQTRS